jgi:hypothetical protein
MSSRNLPHHLYVHVDSAFFRGGKQRFEPAVWFAIRAEPDRAWGCHVMLGVRRCLSQSTTSRASL